MQAMGSAELRVIATELVTQVRICDAKCGLTAGPAFAAL
jgi:hypothetical protein